MTTISCIITSFNNSLYIRQAVESVLSQTRLPDEVIIADDASTDNSREVIRSLAANSKIIKTVFRDQNLGVAANRDLAIKGAKCDLFTTLDGDDFYYPAKIEKELVALMKHNNSMAYSNYDRVGNDGTFKRLLSLDAFSKLTHKERISHILFRQKYIPRDMLIPKSLYNAVGGFVHSLPTYEDWELSLRLAASDCEWVHSGITGMAYRKTKDGLSSSRKNERLTTFLDIFSRNSKWLIEQLGEDTVGKAIIKLVARDIGYRKITLSKKQRLHPLAFLSNEKIT